MQVEFLESDEPADEPALPPRPRRRGVIPGAIAALVAIVATLLVVHRNDDTAPPVADATAAAPLISLPPHSSPVTHERTDGLDYTTWVRLSGRHCPEHGTCTVLTTAAHDADAAVHALFPHFTIHRSLTTIADRRLWYREVSAVSDGMTLTVTVRRNTHPTGRVTTFGMPGPMEGGLTFVQAMQGSYAVVVGVTGTTHSTAFMTKLQTLAHDPRLLRFG